MNSRTDRESCRRPPRIGRSGLCAFLFFVLLSSALFVSSPGAVTHLPIGDTGYEESAHFIFRENDLPLIEVTLDSADFASLLDDPWQDEYKRCTVRFRNDVTDETIENVGIRVRGSTSRGAIKKSWKLSLDEFVSGRQFHGMERLNLNGDRDDPSVIRSRIAMDLYKKAGVPSPRLRHARLKINDGSEVEGVFFLVEQVDEEFAEAWFGNKDGTLYKCRYRDERADLRFIEPGGGAVYRDLGGREVYDEKRYDEASDYEDLAAFIAFIDESDDDEFAAGIGDWLELDGFLRAMAVDVVIGHWDGYWYGANNYYLYRNEETGRFEYVPWDLDNTYGIDYFGIDWSVRSVESFGDGGFGSLPGSLPPLMTRVLENPLFLARMKGYIREFAAGPFALASTEEMIDRIYREILPFVYEGSYRNRQVDRAYDKNSFIRSYNEPDFFIGSRDAWDYGLKPFIRDRVDYLSFRVHHPSLLPRVRVNEIGAGVVGFVDESGVAEPWVELFNDEPARVRLGGMYLSDDPKDPLKWPMTDGLSIPAFGHLVIWCDGDAGDGEDHAPFRLADEGEGIVLSLDDENRNLVVDYLGYERLADGVSYGRLEDAPHRAMYMIEPTPGEPNRFGGNAPPVIDRVERSPLAPEDDEPHQVRARVFDLDGVVDRVVLHIDGGSGFDERTMEAEAEWGEDGARTYAVSLAGFPERKRVSYYVEAVDESGAVAVDPPGAPVETHRYVVGFEPPSLVINELASDNDAGHTDEEGEFDDWVEIYNGGDTPLDLGDLALTDDRSRPDRYLFPSIVLEPGGFLLIWCDGETEEGNLHTPFRISSSGEWIGLIATAGDGRMPIDSVTVPALGEDRSWARTADGGDRWEQPVYPTPGFSNGDAGPSGALPVGGPALQLRPNPSLGGGGGNSIIAFRLERTAPVLVRLFDVAGRERARPVDATYGPGDRRIPWDRKGNSGAALPAGVYFLRLQAGGRMETNRVVLVR